MYLQVNNTSLAGICWNLKPAPFLLKANGDFMCGGGGGAAEWYVVKKHDPQ